LLNCIQVRPGDFLMLNLVLVGLAALLGGGLSSLGLLAVWVLSAGGGEGGAARAKTGRLGDEASSEGGWSEISTGGPHVHAGILACDTGPTDVGWWYSAARSVRRSTWVQKLPEGLWRRRSQHKPHALAI
jgi:hypothetical protein